MKPLLILLAVAVSAPVALAGPTASQHPRVGQLAAVTFEHGSAELVVRADTSLARELGEVAAWAAEHPDGVVVLAGHADRTGPRQLSRRLSLERAKVVRDQLLALDVDPDQIVIAAFGESGPQTKRNRTVVVWVTSAASR